MPLLKLTDYNDEPVFVHTDAISTFSKAGGRGSRIWCGGLLTFVKETPNEIISQWEEKNELQTVAIQPEKPFPGGGNLPPLA